VRAVHELCRTFGPGFTDAVVMPAFKAAFLADDRAAAVADGTRWVAVRVCAAGLTQGVGPGPDRRGRLLGVYVGAVVGSLRVEGAARVLRELVISIAMQVPFPLARAGSLAAGLITIVRTGGRLDGRAPADV
jgi:hypothetical protein